MPLHSSPPLPASPSPAHATRRVWLAYAGVCLLCWALYGVAGTDWQRGAGQMWDAFYEATWNLGPPMLLGVAVLPWTRRLQRLGLAWPAGVLLHMLAALAFAVLWHVVDFSLAWAFFGPDHASAASMCIAMVLGFGGALHARRAQASALAAAQAEAALVRAELAAISGKLNPHFFFNTLNSIHFLMRKDAAAAEQALLGFARMMRYLLDARRGAADRVPLHEELDFVRDYLALESLRLGARLKVEWAIDDATLDDEIPPLSLQPLVENCIVHGIAPQIEGGTVRIEAQRGPRPATLALRVTDDGAGCHWPRSEPEGRAPGVGLGSLRRRFEVDYEGRAHLQVTSAPGAGFRVEILIPQPEMSP
jgi:signal transduction histidine kinase